MAQLFPDLQLKFVKFLAKSSILKLRKMSQKPPSPPPSPATTAAPASSPEVGKGQSSPAPPAGDSAAAANEGSDTRKDPNAAASSEASTSILPPIPNAESKAKEGQLRTSSQSGTNVTLPKSDDANPEKTTGTV